jgi:uncharacterized protein (TIGR03663 family)
MAVRKEVSISIFSFLFLVVLALSLGSFYRFPGLDRRPMHTDEAILGIKLADYTQTGHFQYDPKDYHGPALHQFSNLWGKIAGWGDPMTWTEADLRLVAVLCGMGLLFVTLLFRDVLGRLGTGLAMLMSAVSPMMVYYSRYFIMEMQLALLVAITLGCFWRYSQGGSRLWLLLAGCSLGFQHATKETFIINVAAAIAGWIVARVIVGDFQPQKSNSLRLSSYSSKNRATLPTVWVLIPAVLISVASFSSGFRDWHAVQDSLMTYMNYLERSTGSGHEKPWHYYITLLFWRQDGLKWSESMIGILGLIGMFYSFVGEFKNSPRQAFLVFLSVYTLVLFGVYSLLSYKTPWCILSAQYSLTLLAGAGAGWIWTWLDRRISRFFYKIAIGVGIYFLCGQSKFATDEYRADQRNPYVYSHTTTDLLRLVAEVKKIAAEKGPTFSAQVINHDSGWPLPWYWRALPKIGYQMTPPEKLDAPLIIVDADQAPIVKARLEGRDYVERGPYGLRPGHYLSLFVEKQTEPQPVAQVIPMLEPAAVPAPAATSPSLTPPAGTISTAPTLMPSAPVLPALPAATTPAQP